MDQITARIDDAAQEAPDVEGLLVGEIVRRHGRLTERRGVRIKRVIEHSPDLAVADRLGYLWTGRMHRQTAVVERAGWYYLVELSEHLTRAQVQKVATQPTSIAGAALMSLIDNNGVLPLVDPQVFAPAQMAIDS